MKKKIAILVCILPFVLSACKVQVASDNNKEFAETDITATAPVLVESTIDDINITTMSSNENSIVSLPVLSSEEVYESPIIKGYLTMNLLEDKDLIKEKINGGYKFSNQSIQYYYDEDGKLEWVKAVSDDIETENIRGIKIGDSFDNVLALFPLEKDWQVSKNGEIYGESRGTTDSQFLGPFGNVFSYDWDGVNYKGITLVTEIEMPFFQLDFVNEILMEYRIYINIILD